MCSDLSSKSAGRQRGTALVIALVLLISVTLLSLAAVSNSVLEMRMASADEQRMQIYQATDSAISFVMTNFGDLIKGLAEGDTKYVNCASACPDGSANQVVGAGTDIGKIFDATDLLDLNISLIGAELDPARIKDEGINYVGENATVRLGACDSETCRRFEYLISAELDRRSTDGGWANLFRGYSRQVTTPSSTEEGDFVECPATGCS